MRYPQHWLLLTKNTCYQGKYFLLRQVLPIGPGTSHIGTGTPYWGWYFHFHSARYVLPIGPGTSYWARYVLPIGPGTSYWARYVLPIGPGTSYWARYVLPIGPGTSYWARYFPVGEIIIRWSELKVHSGSLILTVAFKGTYRRADVVQ